MHVRWLAILLLALTAFAVAGCGSSRTGRYGQNGRYPGAYGQRDRGIYSRDRDYRWEQRQREREEWRRRQRRQDRAERRRDRDWDRDRDRYRRRY